MAIKKNYIIVSSEDNEAILVEATSIEECVVKYAEYCGENSELFQKAIIGLEEPDDYIGMYNHFAYRAIVNIIEAGTIFGEKDCLRKVE